MMSDTSLSKYSNIGYARAGRLAGILALAFSLFTATATANDPLKDLAVHAGGFALDRGQAIANLFREGQDVFGKPFMRIAAKIDRGKATLMFAGLPPGNYAVTVFHDENGNNDLDHNFLRMPAEPLGFSNGFKLSLLSGMPSFEKLRFTFGADTKPLEISVK